MNCPIDGTQLQLADRQGVEIDYCPKCRGIWLDRGELDKLIDRSSSMGFDDDHHNDRMERDKPSENSKPRKKESFWGQLFDFD